MRKKAELKKGDYVLASKYDDGHLGDNWCVGWFVGMTEHDEPRYDIIDNSGNLFRGNGFRRAERITPYVGKALIERAMTERWGHMYPRHSIWAKRREISKSDPDKLAMVRMVDGIAYGVDSLRYDAKTTKLKMKSSIGQIQTKLIAKEELKAIILSKAQLVEIALEEFIDSCQVMNCAAPIQ